MHLALFITTATFVLAQLPAFQSIALSSLFSFGSYSSMPSSYRPQTLPYSSPIPPRRNTRISSYRPKSEIVYQTTESEATENRPSAAEIQESHALSSFIDHPLSDVRTNLDIPTTSPNPANISSSELNVSPRPNQTGNNIQKQPPSSFVRNYQGSNTRRKRKARDEELRQATLWHPAQDQNVGPHSGFRDSELLISGTPLQVNQALLAEDTQNQQSKDHHAEASHPSASNTTLGRQQPDISLPTAHPTTTDQTAQSISLVGNKHVPPTIPTSIRGSPSRTIDWRQQVEFDGLSSQGLSHIVMRKNGAGAILSIKPKKKEELDEDAEADKLIKQYTTPNSSRRVADTVVSKLQASKGKRKEQQTPNMDDTKVDLTSATTPPEVIQDGCQPPQQSTTMLLESGRSFATPPRAEHNGANTPSHLKSNFDKRSPIQITQSPAPYPSPIIAELGPDLLSRKITGASTLVPVKPTVQAAVKNSKCPSPSDIIREVLKSHRSTLTEVGHVRGHLSRNDTVDEQTVKGVTQPAAEGRDIVVFCSTAVSVSEPVTNVHDTTLDDRILSESPHASIPHNTDPNDAPCPIFSPSLIALPPSPSDRSEPEEVPSLHERSSHTPQTPLAPSRDIAPSLPSVNIHRRACPDSQITAFDNIYSEELQSVNSAPPQPALPYTVCRITSPEETSWPMHVEPIGAGLQQVFPPSVENTNTSQESRLGRSYGWMVAHPSSVSLHMSESIIIQDASMVVDICDVEGAVPVLDESIGMAEMQVEVEVEAQAYVGIVDSPMTAVDGYDAGVAELDELMAALSLTDLPRDVSSDVEMVDVSFEDDDEQMRVEEVSIAAPQKMPLSSRPTLPLPRKVGRSGTGNRLAPAPAKLTSAVESPRVVKGTGPPKRGLKARVQAVETKLDKLLSGVGFVPTYPNGTPFRIEKCFDWPMDTTPDREFTRCYGGSLTDESMDWTPTDSSSDSDDVEMEDLTCPNPLVSDTFVLPPSAPILHEQVPAQQTLLTLPIAIPIINVAPLPTMPSQPFVQEHSIFSDPALVLNGKASQQEESPSTTTAPKEVPATAELSAEVPKPEPREVHVPSPDVRTSGGGTYNSLDGGDGPTVLGLRCRKVPKWNNFHLFINGVKPTQLRPRGQMPTGPPPSLSEIRAHLSPYRFTPPPRATPQPAAADPKPPLVPTPAPEHAALITTVQPVAPELKYTRECSFPVPHEASHSAVTTPSERTAARPFLHTRLSSAATIERAAAPGLVSHIPEENDQEGHSLVIDTRLGKKVKKPSARKSRKDVEKKSRRKLLSRAPIEPDMVVSVLQDVVEHDPLTHATRWGVEEGSFIATLYAEVSVVHAWLRRNPWYLFEWYMIMLALLFALGNRFFVTSVLLSLCVDPWLIYFRGIFGPISASVSVVVSAASSIRNTVARIRRSIVNLPVIGRLMR